MKCGLREYLDAGLLVLMLSFGVLMTFAAALGPLPGRPGMPVLVIAPPWGIGAPALVQAAGGRLIGPVTAPFGALAIFDEASPEARLLALGAWAARDARAMASLCGVDA